MSCGGAPSSPTSSLTSRRTASSGVFVPFEETGHQRVPSRRPGLVPGQQHLALVLDDGGDDRNRVVVVDEAAAARADGRCSMMSGARTAGRSGISTWNANQDGRRSYYTADGSIDPHLALDGGIRRCLPGCRHRDSREHRVPACGSGPGCGDRVGHDTSGHVSDGVRPRRSALQLGRAAAARRDAVGPFDMMTTEVTVGMFKSHGFHLEQQPIGASPTTIRWWS